VASNIEDLRLRTERHAEETGHTPTVFLAPLGPAKMRSARANFARNVLGVAGFDVVEPLRFDTPDAAAEAAAEADADIVVLCSADSEYPELTPALRQALKDHGLSSLLVVAGNPDKIDADLPVDDFIHQGNLLREKLESLQFHLGIPIDDD
jgi:methylmalonyl-CoA mutase